MILMRIIRVNMMRMMIIMVIMMIPPVRRDTRQKQAFNLGIRTIA